MSVDYDPICGLGILLETWEEVLEYCQKHHLIDELTEQDKELYSYDSGEFLRTVLREKCELLYCTLLNHYSGRWIFVGILIQNIDDASKAHLYKETLELYGLEANFILENIIW